ncbi:YqhR family membrane protein [Cohnella abietis]|uniref:Membrane protein YqhR n=1 Tax=Cohnella abietis TaxID=2507935 RepID=A0A3T1D4M5_9BACL|nr:YqhR family membrane protein [Cohnella abietis]BBI33060.1 hypothetical protein KCTCHS21_24590 [Cohnella abietis]
MAATEMRSKGQGKDSNSPKPTNFYLFSMKIGFFAGFIWGLVRWLSVGLNFTKVSQAFLLDPFVSRKLLNGWGWGVAGLAAFIIMSVIAALLYVLLLGRLQGPWPGLMFGAVWWGLLYAWAGPAVGAVPPLREIGWNSIVIDFCLFIVWGTFIGFSIAFELHNEAESEPANKTEQGSPQATS